jgi:hypothetical protein
MEQHGETCETYKDAERCILDLKHKNDEKREFAEREFLHALLEDYRIMLEMDEEYQSSEEAIAETMEANDYEFTEDGKHV